MSRLAEISLGDIVRGLARYWPVAGVVVVVVGVVSLLPGIDRPGDDAATAPPAPADFRSGGEGEMPRDGEPGASERFDPAPPAAALARPPDPEQGPPAGFALAPSRSPQTPPPGPAPPPRAFDPPSTTGSSETLSVAGYGWAARTGGTPLAGAGVPEGTMPIGARLGQPDKASFVRLTGDGTRLELLEDPEGERSFDGDPAVALCRILDPVWEEEEAMAWSDAPEWDADDCVEGTRGDDARWSFDLAPLGEAQAMAGWALVPGADAPVDFQVTLLPI